MSHSQRISLSINALSCQKRPLLRSRNIVRRKVFPAVTVASQRLEQLAKSLFQSVPGQFQEQLHDWSIGVGHGS